MISCRTVWLKNISKASEWQRNNKVNNMQSTFPRDFRAQKYREAGPTLVPCCRLKTISHSWYVALQNNQLTFTACQGPKCWGLEGEDIGLNQAPLSDMHIPHRFMQPLSSRNAFERNAAVATCCFPILLYLCIYFVILCCFFFQIFSMQLLWYTENSFQFSIACLNNDRKSKGRLVITEDSLSTSWIKEAKGLKDHIWWRLGVWPC